MRVSILLLVFINVNVNRRAEGNLRCVVVNVLTCDIVVTEFELQLCYYVHFWTNILGNGMSPPAMSYIVLLLFSTRMALALNNPQSWIWHLRKKTNQTSYRYRFRKLLSSIVFTKQKLFL